MQKLISSTIPSVLLTLMLGNTFLKMSSDLKECFVKKYEYVHRGAALRNILLIMNLHINTLLQTRLLVTHATTYLSEVDYIIVMKEGRVTENGTYNELMTKQGDFSDFIMTYSQEDLRTALGNFLVQNKIWNCDRLPCRHFLILNCS